MSKNYSNFVRPSSPINTRTSVTSHLTGEEARKIYLEEVKDVKDPTLANPDDYHHTVARRTKTKKHKKEYVNIPDKQLFITAQNNDIDTLRHCLDNNPDKIKLVDEFGWTLLMIACQANSVDVVKELLSRGIDTSIRDKAGNSAHSLVIKNRNTELASLLLDFKNDETYKDNEDNHQLIRKHTKEKYTCNTCNNKTFCDKQEHLSSTIHNINASKGRKIPTNFKIPACNRGYQLMMKVGWDKESGLGPDGSGRKYPIKTVQKKDRKGLGQDNKEKTKKVETTKQMNKKMFLRDHRANRRMEINFRREFY